MIAAKTMAEEIMLHSQIGRDEQGQFCKGCSYRYGYDAERKLNRHASAHVAAALTAAGFGLVVDAKAEALEEAAAVLVEQGNPRPPCPDAEECCGGPSSCGKNQQTTVVASPTWLRARAASLRGQG